VNAIPKVVWVTGMTIILALQRVLLPEAEEVHYPPLIDLLPMPFLAAPARR
jgi:hypothetical protein